MRYCCCWVTKLCPTLCDPWTLRHQAFLSFTISCSLLILMSVESVMASNHLALCCPLSSCPPSLFRWIGSSCQVAKVLELQHQFLPMNIQCWYLLGFIDLISSSPRDSQESSPATQFKSISSSVLRLLYGPALTSIHDYWKNHIFNYLPLLVKWCLCFLICCLGLS